MTSQPTGAARRSPSCSRGAGYSHVASRRPRPGRGRWPVGRAAARSVAVIGWSSRWNGGLPGRARGALASSFVARSGLRRRGACVQASTQSSWSLQVVASSASAQSACGVVQYQILS